MSLLNVEGVALESAASKLNPLAANWRFGENVAFPGESPFIVMPLKVSSRPDEGECFAHGDWPDGGSMVFMGDVSRDAPKRNWSCTAGSRGDGFFNCASELKLAEVRKGAIVAGDFEFADIEFPRPLGVLAAVSKSKSDAICWLLAS